MWSWEGAIDNNLQMKIPHFWFKIRVTKPWLVNDWTTGFTLFIHMQDIEGEVPLCEIESGVDHPMVPGIATFSSERVQEYGKNLRFDPIPMEMLYTPAYKPQVLVKVNGLDAVCPEFNCDFTYFEADDVPSVVGAEFNSEDNSLTITAIDANDFEISSCLENEKEELKIEFAGVPCKGASPILKTAFADGNSIECTLDGKPVAGSHKVHVKSVCGEFDNTNSPDIDIPLAISADIPTRGLSKYGGDRITINGSGFSTKSGENVVNIIDGPKCNIQSQTSTKIVCITDPFGANRRQLAAASNYELTVETGGVTSVTDVALSETENAFATDISPKSMSPVLDTELTVSISDDYDGSIEACRFKSEL